MTYALCKSLAVYYAPIGQSIVGLSMTSEEFKVVAVILRQSATSTNQYRGKPLSNNWAYSRAGDSVDPAASVFTRVTNTRTATL